MAKQLSIVIAHRGSALGLWSTVSSCQMILEKSDYDYEYIIIENGLAKVNDVKSRFDADAFNVGIYLDKLGKLKQWLLYPGTLSPPTARQFGTGFASGKYLFLFDNHCLVSPDYFARAIADFEKYPSMAGLHSVTKYYSGLDGSYEYKLKLASNFWAESKMFPRIAHKPYRVAAGGHGGFVVRKEVWDAVGGYWTGFTGYGGEEIYFDLKLWQLGYEIWIDPYLLHYHFAGSRGYPRHYTDQFYVNMLACANIIGGEAWFDKVALSFINNFTRLESKLDWNAIQEVAYQRSREHAVELAAKRKMNLDELLKYFAENEISY